MDIKQEVENTYLKDAALLKGDIGNLKKKVDQYSLLRLGIFLLSIASIYFLFNYGMVAVVSIVFFSFALFLVLVKIQIKAQNDLDFKTVLLELVQNEIQILQHQSNIYHDGSDFIDPHHRYTDDLDIFGSGSLFAYINRAITLKGIHDLAKWLSESAGKAFIEKKQLAVQELKKYHQENLIFRATLYPLGKNQLTGLSSFIEFKLAAMLSFLRSRAVNMLVKATPFINTALLLIAIFTGGVWWSVFGLGLLFSMTVYLMFKKRIDQLHEMVSRSAGALNAYSKTLKWIETTQWESEYLKEKQQSLNNEHPVFIQIQELANILQNLDYRLNIIVGGFLNLMFLWDLYWLKKLDQWQQKYNVNVLRSFDVIAQFEALISLSTLDYNHPEWIYPTIADDYNFSAHNLGHPLIQAKKRVNNDFRFSGNTTVDVITGSNMAGKSTFLRTVGINMILAFAGAKVCASSFKTSVFNIISYMRIKDSLLDETSTFKAEINRLKMILDITANEKNTFVLIDEMLRGTNSRDKYLGSKVFIKKLIEQRTPGFIATHDLQIAELEKEYPTQLRNFHFDIQVQNGEMFFDYKIKNGECKTFNASLLLKAIGLEIEE